MTCYALGMFGVDARHDHMTCSLPFHSPGKINVEGDWSNGAFFLTAKALGSPLNVVGLDPNSPQGDRVCASILDAMDTHITVSAADIPDLVPILALNLPISRGLE